jgi:hypothetical protein
MTTNPQHHFQAGILKTNDGRHLYFDARTGALELSKEYGSLIAINEEGTLGVGTALLDLPFFLHDGVLSLTGTEDSFVLTCHMDEKSGITFYKDGIVYVFTEDIQLKFLPGDNEVTPIEILLDKKEIPYDLISGHEHCCSVKRPKPRVAPQWNDLGHHVLVDLAISYVAAHHTGTLSDIWGKKEFKDALFQGLKDADYVNPYNDGGTMEGAWRSHFFDPATKKNYRGETDRTAYTEGLKYYQVSTTSSAPAAVGYNLGLALHYFTDLTQPCHAANFAEVYALEYPRKWSLTKVHSFLEEVGDELVATQPPAIVNPVVCNINVTIGDLYIETATIAKAIFQRLLAKAPDLATWYTYVDDINAIVLPDGSVFIPARDRTRSLLLPFVKEALQSGLEQTVKFLDKWNSDFVKVKPGNYYLKMWTADPADYKETWLGYCGLGDDDGYASFLDKDPSGNGRVLVINFLDKQGVVVDPRLYTGPVYMVAVNHPHGPHSLQGSGHDGKYCYWRPMNKLEDGYLLEVYPSNIIAGKFGIRRVHDSKEFHRSGKYYLEYNEGSNDSSITIEFVQA